MSLPSNFSISIPKDVIADMPLVTFPGKITVADTPEKAEYAVSELMKHRVIGFDTETRPSFRKGCANKVALMQLSTADHCFLFRLNIIGIPDSLRQLLEDPDILKIGVSIHDDFNVMHRSSNIVPAGFIDLQNYVKQFHIADAALQRIYAIIFGEKISKSQRLTNWEAFTLTSRQQAYASIDAWACLRIWDYLEQDLFIPEQSPYIVIPETPSEE